MKYTKDAEAILKRTSALALLLRDADEESLEQVEDRLKRFHNAFMKDGEEDVLPCSGKNSDEGGALCDTDVTESIRELVLGRLTNF